MDYQNLLLCKNLPKRNNELRDIVYVDWGVLRL